MFSQKRTSSKNLRITLQDANIALEHWFEESTKYEALHISSDQIKAEINRLNTLQNQIRLELLKRDFTRQKVYLLWLLIWIILLIFEKPVLRFELTLNNTILLAVAALLTAVAAPVISLMMTQKDREAQREHNIQQAKYTQMQTKVIESQLDKIKK